MVDIRINYETLFDLLRREKNREELQTMDKDFYEQVLAYLKEKKDSLSKKEDELFASAEREKLKIQFQNIRRIIKELYEKREKKIINMATSRARTGSDVMDTSALLPSEKDFFSDQVALLVKYKDSVLDRIIHLKEFESPSPEERKPDVRAEVKQEVEALKEEKEQDNGRAGKDEPSSLAANETADAANDGKEFSAALAGLAEKKRILITDSMPKFMGLKGEILGPFNEGEEVELDSQIADVLVKRGKAEAVQ
jgi:DNA replication initiation complex subunit (GINS family)